MVAGLGLGLALVVLLEYRDFSFKTDEEVADLLELPVLAVVPLMESESERRRASRRRWMRVCVLGSTVACCAVVLVYALVR
jgi:hypothetical protein